jgi:hypothetical protein
VLGQDPGGGGEDRLVQDRTPGVRRACHVAPKGCNTYVAITIHT